MNNLSIFILISFIACIYAGSFREEVKAQKASNSLRGVNLGSWFIPESWMVNFYDGTNATDLCSFGKLDRKLADERMRVHLNTWIVEDDFKWLATQGINTVRLPLGYWNIVHDWYNMYVPISQAESMSFIDKAFDWAEKYGMTVLLDLHGAPGSQNGNDHSGCGNGVVGWDTDFNRNLSVQAISALAENYGNRKNLYGIELMNEPAWTLEENSHANMLHYYQEGYKAIRKHSKTAVVVFNVLYSQFYDAWDNELTPAQGYDGIVEDWHLYDCFGENEQYTTEQHIADAESWGPMIAAHVPYHPIFVGEWSLGTGVNPGGQPYADAQEKSYENGIGFYFWALKLAESKDSPEWSFSSAIRHGYKL